MTPGTDIGIVRERRAQRASILNGASPAVRRRILGTPPHDADAISTTITVNVPTGERKIERMIERLVGQSEATIERRVQAALDKVVDAAIARVVERQSKAIEAMVGGSFVNPKEILGIVCDVTGVSLGDMIGPRRARNLAWPRHLLCYALKHCRPDMSLPAIGRIVGRRDHTTVMHALRNFGNRRDEPPFSGWLADPRIVALLSSKTAGEP